MDKEQFLEEEILRLRKERSLKLEGNCIGCGKCCEGKVKIYQINNNLKTLELSHVLETECFFYDKETKRCKNYSDRKHTLCKMFPYLPENLYEGCGYKFIKE